MSSVIKNPMILNSANYIYNWFVGINNQNDGLIKNNNILGAIESDENILNTIYKNQDNEERYNNISQRLKDAKDKLNGK